ncbi:MAG: DNA repair protein RecO [Candidatus Rokubacteria bacterium GWC2_70_16]|nr:MAG: DNA repair protein RecO [Candidatus Rokubacteria bacterium GWC2_70_16]OGL21023.1 MAG: DNA repair protein RecO [Candidatus Rokubacteria bacterium RIFCSPLOWO2_12_FULL_71_19]
MALHRSRAVVIGRKALGESDRLVEFYTRDFGKVRGVAKSARRPRSRFVAALEPFTLGDLVFFDTGRSELVRVDHFDILHPFVRVREHLERLGRGAWTVECLARLSADRDPHPALFGLLVRSLRALEGGTSPARVAVCFGVRAVDLLGHRPRIDRCVECGRASPFPDAVLDVEAGGLVCGPCGPRAHAIPLSGGAVGTLGRLRGLSWEEGLRLPLSPALDEELTGVLEGTVTRLMGQVPRSLRFLAQTRRPLPPVLS